MTTLQRDRESRRARNGLLGPLCIAQFLLVADVVVVNVALPTMAAELEVSDGRLQLISVSYTVTFGSLLITFGRIGDVVGRRRLFLLGLATFALASSAAAFAGSEAALIASRAAQGVGAAMVSPSALALLIAAFPEGADRNRALGYWGAAGSSGAIAGQLLGGVLTDAFGWHSIFLVNVPAGVATFLLAARHLHESREPRRRELDIRGACLLTGSLATLIVGLTRIADDHPLSGLLAILLAGALAAGFVAAEARHPDPLVTPRLLQTGSVAAGNLLLALNAGTLGGALFFTTLYLQVTLGHSALAVGFAFAPITLLILVLAPRVGAHAEAVGIRHLLMVGSTASALGLALLARLPDSGSYARDVFPAMVLLAVGSAASYAPTFIAGTSGVPAEDHGVASGVLNASQEIGAAVGVTVLATIAASTGGAGDLPGRRLALVGAASMMALSLVVIRRLPGRPGASEALRSEPGRR